MSPKRLSIFDIATMYEGEQDSATAVPGARVKISTNRIYYGKDTKGCFLPGDSYSFDEMTETYNVWNSKKRQKNFLISLITTEKME